MTQGGRFGGHGLYIKDGKSTFTYNLLGIERPKWQGAEALAPGKHTIVFESKMDPEGMAVARGGIGTLSVNGKQVAERKLTKTLPFYAKTFDQRIIKLMTGQMTPITDARQDLPPALVDWITRLLNNDPTKRYETAEAALAALP